MSVRSGCVAVIGAVLTVTLAACSSPQPGPTATAPPASATMDVSTPEPVVTTPPPDAAALDIPTCEEIFPLADVRAQFDDRVEFFPELDDVPTGLLPEPAARQAVTSATAAATCTWGYPASDGLFHITVADIEPATGDELVAGFRAESGYTESELDGAVVFTRVVEDAMQYTLAHALSGGVWVIVDGTMLDEESAADLAGASLATVLEANP